MAHRDALAAAQARIAALETELEHARAGAAASADADALRDRLAAVERELTQARSELARARAEGEHAREVAKTEALVRARAEERARVKSAERERVKAERAARDVATMTTLDAHNRALPPPPRSTPDWKPAGVLCPACAAAGERVEMVLRGLMGSHESGSVQLSNVTCLRCGHMGALRRG